MSARKPPRCRSCKHPMKGHNKLGLCLSASPEVLSKEEEEAEHAAEQLQLQNQQQQEPVSAHSYMSPPPTPPPSSAYTTSSESPQPPAPAPTAGTSTATAMGPPTTLHLARARIHRTYTPAIMSEPSFTIPETGYFHRRNPNFVHAPPPAVPDACDDGDTVPDCEGAAAGYGYGYGYGPGQAQAQVYGRGYGYGQGSRASAGYGGGDGEEEDDDGEGGSGAQTPTVIIGSDGESAAALSDRSGSASPGPGARTPRAHQYYPRGEVSGSGSAFFGGEVVRRAGWRRGAAKEHSAPRTHQPSVGVALCPPPPPVSRAARSPRPAHQHQQREKERKRRRNGGAFAGGLAYLGSFNWIRSPSPQDTAAAVGGAGAGTKRTHVSELAGRLRHHPYHHQQHQEDIGTGTGIASSKFSPRDLLALGAVVVVGSALSMVLVLYFGRAFL